MMLEVTADELRTLIAAMYDKRFESMRYRNSNPTPREPESKDTCCDAHLARWKRNRELYVSLVERVKFEDALIEKLEAEETR